nr:MAG TPA: hypothetical protein [Caudoviricetes sp.]
MGSTPATRRRARSSIRCFAFPRAAPLRRAAAARTASTSSRRWARRASPSPAPRRGC